MLQKTMKYDYALLLQRINEYYDSFSQFAREMGMIDQELKLRIKSKVYFNQDEIVHACILLNIPDSEINLYFFKFEPTVNEKKLIYLFEELSRERKLEVCMLLGVTVETARELCS